jgi:hypothetical protein
MPFVVRSALHAACQSWPPLGHHQAAARISSETSAEFSTLHGVYKLCVHAQTRPAVVAFTTQVPA